MRYLRAARQRDVEDGSLRRGKGDVHVQVFERAGDLDQASGVGAPIVKFILTRIRVQRLEIPWP